MATAGSRSLYGVKDASPRHKVSSSSHSKATTMTLSSAQLDERRISENELEVNQLRRALAELEDLDLRGVTLHHFEKSLGWLTGSIASSAFPEPVSLLVEFPPGYPANEPPKFFFPRSSGNKLLENLPQAVHDVAVVYQKNKLKNPAGRCLEDCLVFICRVLQNSSTFFPSWGGMGADTSASPLVVGSNNSATLASMMMTSIHHPSTTATSTTTTGYIPTSASVAHLPQIGSSTSIAGHFPSSRSYSDFLSPSGSPLNQSPAPFAPHQGGGEGVLRPISSGQRSGARMIMMGQNHDSSSGMSSSTGGDSSSSGHSNTAVVLSIRMFDDDEWLPAAEWKGPNLSATKQSASTTMNSTGHGVVIERNNSTTTATGKKGSGEERPVLISKRNSSTGELEFPIPPRRRCGASFSGNDLLVVFTSSTVPILAQRGTAPTSQSSFLEAAYPIFPTTIHAATSTGYQSGVSKAKAAGASTSTVLWDSDEETDRSTPGGVSTASSLLETSRFGSLAGSSPSSSEAHPAATTGGYRETTQLSVLRFEDAPLRYSIESESNDQEAPTETARLAWKLLEQKPVENTLSIEAMRALVDDLKRMNDFETLVMLAVRAQLAFPAQDILRLDRREVNRYQRTLSDRLQRAGAFFDRCALEKIVGDTASATSAMMDALWKYHPEIECALCRMSVRSSVTFCAKCNHGGHARCLASWFAVEDVCPTGCGCQCDAN